MAEYGCSRGTVCKIRKELGLKRPNLQHPKVEQIQAAIRNGMRWSVIIKTFGCGESTLSNYRKKIGYVNKIPH
jgi:DNA invertase Pin-like site-specific DNA recombinase